MKGSEQDRNLWDDNHGLPTLAAIAAITCFLLRSLTVGESPSYAELTAFYPFPHPHGRGITPSCL
jgi:hypothetical protein